MEDPSYNSTPDKDAPWTDSETLLLFEGLKAFDNDWNAISKHVGSRTREECVMNFLQLDIQDQYLDGGVQNGSTNLHTLGGREPINQAEKSSHVRRQLPRTAGRPQGRRSSISAASQRSTDQLIKEIRSGLDRGVGGSAPSEQGKEKNVKAEGEGEDSMDVDGEAQYTSSNGTSQSQPSAEVDLATVGLASAASRSAGLVTIEERELTRLVGAAVNLTLQKFELKLAQFAEMEEIVQAGRHDLEKGRQQLFLDRLAFKKRAKDMETTFRQASLKTPEEGMRLMQEVVGGERGKGYAFGSTKESKSVQPLSAEGGDGFKKMEI
jgi:SWI/SNF related-matrix-associated actin-dependent regulator of chromatin subfamily C